MKPVYMTIANTITPAKARACEIVFVAAASVRNIADIVNMVINVKRKKMKKFPGSLLRSPRKYMMRLKTVLMMNFIGISETIPAKASTHA